MVESCQLDAAGEARRTENRYHGFWYQQGETEYLVYEEDGVRHTLRWDRHEWRLFRRGAQLEGWQIFRPGRRLESDLRIGAQALPLSTDTKHMRVKRMAEGLQLYLAYDLYSAEDLLGKFSLIIHLQLEEEAHHGAT